LAGERFEWGFLWRRGIRVVVSRVPSGVWQQVLLVSIPVIGNKHKGSSFLIFRISIWYFGIYRSWFGSFSRGKRLRNSIFRIIEHNAGRNRMFHLTFERIGFGGFSWGKRLSWFL